MKNVLLFVFILLTVTLNAQITITSSDLPAAGDTFLLYEDTITMIDIGTVGIDQHWDFTSLQTNTIIAQAYGNTADLPFATAFPNSSIYSGDSANYTMLKTDAGGFEVNGLRANIGFGIQNYNFTDPGLIIGTPCTFGTVFNDYSEWEVAIDANAADMDTFIYITTTKTLDCDAWGSLETPDGYYPDVIRIHNYAINVTTAVLKLGPTVLGEMEISRDTTNQYMFLTNNLGYTIASIEYNPAGDTLIKSEYLYTPYINNGSIVSVTDGNWMTPTTWDCMCIPMPGDDITINHDVKLNIDFYVGNSLLINTVGSLTEDDTLRYFGSMGADIINNGTMRISYFATDSGSLLNNDSLLILNSFYNNADFTNNGIVAETDSMFNDGSLLNNGSVLADNFTNNSTAENYGVMNHGNFTNSGDYTNKGTVNFNDFTNFTDFTNYNSLVGTNDFSNAGNFFNTLNATFTIANDFMNADLTNYTSLFVNNGIVEVDGSWLNNDTVTGIESGQFTVGLSSSNTGIMEGDFDFCDLTPPPSYPYIDYNTGAIDPLITFCTPTNIEGGSNANKLHTDLFPVPVADIAYFSIAGIDRADYVLRIFDITGKETASFSGVCDGIITFARQDLSSGMYMYQLFINKNLIKTDKLILE